MQRWPPLFSLSQHHPAPTGHGLRALKVGLNQPGRAEPRKCKGSSSIKRPQAIARSESAKAGRAWREECDDGSADSAAASGIHRTSLRRARSSQKRSQVDANPAGHLPGSDQRQRSSALSGSAIGPLEALARPNHGTDPQRSFREWIHSSRRPIRSDFTGALALSSTSVNGS